MSGVQFPPHFAVSSWLPEGKKGKLEHLRFVWFDEGRILATDGHAALVVKPDGFEYDEAFCVDQEQLKKMEKAARPLKDAAPVVEIPDRGRYSGGAFQAPAIDRIIRDLEATPAALRVRFDSKFLIRIAAHLEREEETLKREGRVDECLDVDLVIRGLDDPLTFETSTGRSVMLVMPVMPYHPSPDVESIDAALRAAVTLVMNLRTREKLKLGIGRKTLTFEEEAEVKRAARGELQELIEAAWARVGEADL